MTYIPPASVPSPPNDQPTLTATSVADASKSGADTFTITSTVANSCGAPGGQESLLQGHYALLMEGFAGSGTGTPILRAASFLANGSGGVTSGEEDINDTISPQHVSFTSSGSLYTVGSDHRGCLQLTNAGGTTTIFRFALGGINSGVASKGSVIEFDDNSGNGSGSRGSGILRLQDPNSFVLSALQNQYAFGVDGWTPGNNQLVRFSAAGAIQREPDQRRGRPQFRRHHVSRDTAITGGGLILFPRPAAGRPASSIFSIGRSISLIRRNFLSSEPIR